jgi:hypothetical protein
MRRLRCRNIVLLENNQFLKCFIQKKDHSGIYLLDFGKIRTFFHFIGGRSQSQYRSRIIGTVQESKNEEAQVLAPALTL